MAVPSAPSPERTPPHKTFLYIGHKKLSPWKLSSDQAQGLNQKE
jgi:hypothetical protein